MVKRIITDFISSIFTLQSSLRYALTSRASWRLPSAVLLRACNPPQADYGCALRCLAYENLQLVQNSGKKYNSFLHTNSKLSIFKGNYSISQSVMVGRCGAAC